ncbi:hypothetical protein SNOG_09082 [Parastagonospora nodorum SN15]|uniref:Uncharacterized protein n=1 Tax=Phaeosphaeria nodorum (strain SN15 / ATCC MYA-4574 / FGSC 10173) TaxID=321614 RepID=Q0UGN2_PHANO|nr:hypothetical protein SNOG_09082 [Parastagonospora nodorum SN15]EAT83274.1 hypothetical protein SNOG_09082 [Parastagonospora nodorum SN15]
MSGFEQAVSSLSALNCWHRLQTRPDNGNRMRRQVQEIQLISVKDPRFQQESLPQPDPQQQYKLPRRN